MAASRRWLASAGSLALAIVLAAGAIDLRNDLVTSDEQVATAWGRVESVLQRRADLIPAIQAVAEGHAAHERALLAGFAEALLVPARLGADRIGEVRERERALVAARAAVEANPRLSSSASWETLRREVVGSENRIAVERRRYNEAVRTHRARLRTLPGRLLAPLLGFTDAPEY